MISKEELILKLQAELVETDAKITTAGIEMLTLGATERYKQAEIVLRAGLRLAWQALQMQAVIAELQRAPYDGVDEVEIRARFSDDLARAWEAKSERADAQDALTELFDAMLNKADPCATVTGDDILAWRALSDADRDRLRPIHQRLYGRRAPYLTTFPEPGSLLDDAWPHLAKAIRAGEMTPSAAAAAILAYYGGKRPGGADAECIKQLERLANPMKRIWGCEKPVSAPVGLRELEAFPEGHDDQVDALSGAFRQCLAKATPQAPTKPVAGNRRWDP